VSWRLSASVASPFASEALPPALGVGSRSLRSACASFLAVSPFEFGLHFLHWKELIGNFKDKRFARVDGKNAFQKWNGERIEEWPNAVRMKF
jgi:hypothetical protein